MAVTQSPRLGITRWGAGTDPFRRSQLDADHDLLDQLVAIFGQGTFNARPAAGKAGRYYYATDQARHYYDDGAVWVELGIPLSSSAPAALGAAAAVGVGNTSARADHVHPYPTAAQVGAAPTNHNHDAAAITTGVLAIGRIPTVASGVSSATGVPLANDARLSDARTPTAHTHAQADVTGLTAALAGKLDTAGGTVTGDLTLAGARTTVGDADTDVVRARALEVETHTRSVTNTYTSGKLTSVVEKAGAATVKTTTLAYTGDQLTTVTETADGLTITTTLTYNGAGELTGTTRTVA